MTISESNITSKEDQKRDQWFEGFINAIKADHLQIQTNTASDEKSRLYNNMIEGKHLEVVSEMRNVSSQFFIQSLVTDFLKELEVRNVSTNKLAFDLGDAKVLVWAEIDDDDEASEDGLILAEAKVNADYSKNGFHITSTIIESGDNQSVPPHYASIKQ